MWPLFEVTLLSLETLDSKPTDGYERDDDDQ